MDGGRWWTQVGMIHVPGGKGWVARDFITLLRRVCNLKLMNHLFLKFFIYYFPMAIDCRYLKPHKAKAQIREGLPYSRGQGHAEHVSVSIPSYSSNPVFPLSLPLQSYIIPRTSNERWNISGNIPFHIYLICRNRE